MKDTDSAPSWSRALGALLPYLTVLLPLMFKLTLLLYPNRAIRSLMDHYLRIGISVRGQVLSCEEKSGPSLSPPARGNMLHVVEVIYERVQHKNASDPSAQFRHPEDVVSKKFVRRFELQRKVARGDEVEVLVLPGEPRSGLPRDVVETFLAEHERRRVAGAMVWGLAGLCICTLGFAIAEVLRMDDVAAGWATLVAGTCTVELVPLLYCTDEFLKSKRRRFNSARPMRPVKSGKSK